MTKSAVCSGTYRCSVPGMWVKGHKAGYRWERPFWGNRMSSCGEAWALNKTIRRRRVAARPGYNCRRCANNLYSLYLSVWQFTPLCFFWMVSLDDVQWQFFLNNATIIFIIKLPHYSCIMLLRVTSKQLHFPGVSGVFLYSHLNCLACSGD